jgi:hypothetical protein
VEVISTIRLSKELVATGKQHKNKITITAANAEYTFLDNLKLNVIKITNNNTSSNFKNG